jgi:hypothetical protein
MGKSSHDSKKRKQVFRSSKRNTKRKKQLAKASKKGSSVKSSWSRQVEKYFQRYLDSAFDTNSVTQFGMRPDKHILRLTASRVYKVFIPSLRYNKNIQYPHKEASTAVEVEVLDIFLKKTRWTVYRPGMIVHPKYFFMSCIPDAIIRNRKETCLVEIKTKWKRDEEIIEGQVEEGLDKLKNRWWHQVQFSLHVCDLKRGFLLFYDADKKEIFENQVIERDEDYLQTHLNRFVNYFTEKIFFTCHPLNSFSQSFRENGFEKTVSRVWEEMNKNELRMKDLQSEGKDHFRALYESLPFEKWE